MNKAKSLWASVQGDPVFMRRFNGWSTIIFLALVPVSAIFNWVASTTFVSYLSLIALILGSLSAWQASRVEVVQQEQEERQDRKGEEKVQEIVEKVDEITPDK